MAKIARPLMLYQGSKFKIASWIISHIPKHKVYVEPFGGVASVLIKKAPSEYEIYNDTDNAVVNVFRVLRDKDKAKRLSDLLWLTPYSRNEYRENTEWLDTDDDIEKARKTICRSFFGIAAGSAIRSLGGFNVRLNENYKPSSYKSFLSIHAYIIEYAERMRNVLIEQKDAEFILDYYDSSVTFFYLDPPYLLNTWNKTDKKVYSNILSDNNHESLLNKLCKIEGMAIISGYDNDMYNDILKDWKTSCLRTHNQTNDYRIEKIWINQKCFEGMEKQRTLF